MRWKTPDLLVNLVLTLMWFNSFFQWLPDLTRGAMYKGGYFFLTRFYITDSGTKTLRPAITRLSL